MKYKLIRLHGILYYNLISEVISIRKKNGFKIIVIFRKSYIRYECRMKDRCNSIYGKCLVIFLKLFVSRHSQAEVIMQFPKDLRGFPKMSEKIEIFELIINIGILKRIISTDILEYDTVKLYEAATAIKVKTQVTDPFFSPEQATTSFMLNL